MKYKKYKYYTDKTDRFRKLFRHNLETEEWEIRIRFDNEPMWVEYSPGNPEWARARARNFVEITDEEAFTEML